MRDTKIEQVVWTSPTDPRTRIVRIGSSDHFEFQRLYDTPGSQMWSDEFVRHPDDHPNEIEHPDAFDELVLAALRSADRSGKED